MKRSYPSRSEKENLKKSRSGEKKASVVSGADNSD